MSKSENPEENSSSIISNSSGLKTRIWVYAPVALVCLLIIGVWSLISLPIILYYHLPKSEISSKNYTSNTYGAEPLCSTPLQYATSSGICLTEIANTLISSNCSHDTEEYLLVKSNEEATAVQLINGFTSLGASAECLHKAVPFLCLHLFGLCSGSGVSIQPTSSQCEEIRDRTCQHQWMFIESLDIGLPDCEIFPAETLSCPASNDTYSTIATNLLDLVEKHSSNATVAVLECTGDYYQENGSSFCTRSCYSWVRLGNGIWPLSDVLAVVVWIISILTCGAIIVLSCLASKRMLIFPAVFIVYMVIGYMIPSFFVLIGCMDRIKFFCPSRSMIKSLREVTPFCVIFGIDLAYIFWLFVILHIFLENVGSPAQLVYWYFLWGGVNAFTSILSVYLTCQVTLWWLFHTGTLFWKVIFPFHARTFEASGRNKHIHITCIMVGILLPLVPIIVIMADTAKKFHKQNENSTTSQLGNSLFLSEGLGFGYTHFPPIMCYATNSDAVFYSLYLMLGTFLGCGCTMLIVIFWSVHNVHIKRKQAKKNINFKVNEKPGLQFTFGTAEKKLFILLSYYVLFTIILTFFTLDSRMATQTINGLQKFLFCEQGNRNSSNPCIRNSAIDGDSIGFATFRGLTNMVLCSFPLVQLLYTLNIQELKELWKKGTQSIVHKHY